ncbi:MAG: hypothetical protein ACLTU1_14395 [Blautia wexlerae]
MTYWTKSVDYYAKCSRADYQRREPFDKAQVRLSSTTESNKTTVGWEEDERAFTMYCIVRCKRKCVHVDAEAMRITLAMLPGIGMKKM